MRAQVSLTSAESKKLIAKAVARMDIVTRARNEGMGRGSIFRGSRS